MASPQVEDGYTEISNELLDAVIRFDFTKRQYKVLLAVIRKTYGWRKRADDIPSTQLGEMTGLADTHCRAAVRELVALGVLDVQPGRFGQVIALTKDYEHWGRGVVRQGPTQVGPKQSGERTKMVRGEDQNGPSTRTKTVREGGPKRSSQNTTSKYNSKRNPPGGIERENIPRAQERSAPLVALSQVPLGSLLAIADATRPDLSDPQRVLDKFKAHHNGSRYTSQIWESKWRLWLLNERESHSERRSANTGRTRAPGSFLATSRLDLIADYEVLRNES